MTSRKYVPVETVAVAAPPLLVEEPRSFWEKAATAATIAVLVPFALLLLIGL